MLKQLKSLGEHLIKRGPKVGRRWLARRKGRSQWMNFRQIWKNCSYSDQLPEARQKASELVRKLAPECEIAGYETQFPIFRSLLTPLGKADVYLIDGECCSHTFNFFKDKGIPAEERALTLYFWKKFYPKHFEKRPWRHKIWG